MVVDQFVTELDAAERGPDSVRGERVGKLAPCRLALAELLDGPDPRDNVVLEQNELVCPHFGEHPAVTELVVEHANDVRHPFAFQCRSGRAPIGKSRNDNPHSSQVMYAWQAWPVPFSTITPTPLAVPVGTRIPWSPNVQMTPEPFADPSTAL